MLAETRYCYKQTQLAIAHNTHAHFTLLCPHSISLVINWITSMRNTYIDRCTRQKYVQGIYGRSSSEWVGCEQRRATVKALHEFILCDQFTLSLFHFLWSKSSGWVKPYLVRGHKNSHLGFLRILLRVGETLGSKSPLERKSSGFPWLLPTAKPLVYN